MKKIFLAAILLGLISPLFAGGRFVKCTTSDNKDNKVIKVSQSSEKTEIIGNISRTIVELIITNSSDRVLEGEFEFPLEKGESVTGFALDINGKMRNAVAVEKEKGRQIFEDVVRKNVDPALLEMTAGNSFKTRVYPLPANGFRQIRVIIEKKLAATAPNAKKDTVFTQTIGKDTFFYYYPDLSDFIKENGKIKRTLPDTVTIFYDVSSSGENRDKNKEISFIKEYLSEANISEIKVVTFSNEIHEQKSFKSVADTVNFLDSQIFDGGTNLNIDFSKENAGQIFLVSDGIHNFGEANEFLNKNNDRNKIIAVNSNTAADFTMLNSIAFQTVDLNTSSVSQALEQVMYKNLCLLKSEYDESVFEQINPDTKYSSFVDESFCVSGILKKKSGSIKLSFGYEQGKSLCTKEISVSSYETEKCVSVDNVSGLWAADKIANLSKSYDANKNEIISLAKKYAIVTPDTSLIVLDSVNDYIRYGIVPPEELLEEYNRLATRTNTVKSESDGTIPSEVYRTFEEFKKWWNTNPKDFKKKKGKTWTGNGYNPEGPASTESNVFGYVDASNAIEFVYDDSIVEAEPEVYSDMVMEGLRSEAENRADRVVLSERTMEKKMAKSESAKKTAHQNVPEQKASVVLQAWSSDVQYLTVLKKTPENKMYEKYLELKKEHKSSPAFYMEVADYFAEENMKSQALRILSNLAEMNLENTDVLRALGNKLNDWKEYEKSCAMFEKLCKLRPEVPQFLRDLGFAYSNAGKKQEAVDTFWKVVCGKWDSRYSQIQQTVLNDMNAIIAENKKLDTSSFDDKLLQNFDVDIRIVLTWNTDDCDIDLWVTDPDNEKCYYRNKLTENGGRMSRDFTRGYGPEEFVIRNAPKGKYIIQANYFANHQQKLLQPVTVQAEVYTNFGRPDQTCQLLTLQLNDIKNTFDIGEITF